MRRSPEERGYDRAWRKTSKAFLAAYPLCADRGPRCRGQASEVHHIDGLGPNGPRGHDWSNLLSLCKPCHASRTGKHNQATKPSGFHALTRSTKRKGQRHPGVVS